MAGPLAAGISALVRAGGPALGAYWGAERVRDGISAPESGESGYRPATATSTESLPVSASDFLPSTEYPATPSLAEDYSTPVADPLPPQGGFGEDQPEASWQDTIMPIEEVDTLIDRLDTASGKKRTPEEWIKFLKSSDLPHDMPSVSGQSLRYSGLEEALSVLPPEKIGKEQLQEALSNWPHTQKVAEESYPEAQFPRLSTHNLRYAGTTKTALYTPTDHEDPFLARPRHIYQEENQLPGKTPTSWRRTTTLETRDPSSGEVLEEQFILMAVQSDLENTAHQVRDAFARFPELPEVIPFLDKFLSRTTPWPGEADHSISSTIQLHQAVESLKRDMLQDPDNVSSLAAIEARAEEVIWAALEYRGANLEEAKKVTPGSTGYVRTHVRGAIGEALNRGFHRLYVPTHQTTKAGGEGRTVFAPKRLYDETIPKAIKQTFQDHSVPFRTWMTNIDNHPYRAYDLSGFQDTPKLRYACGGLVKKDLSAADFLP